MPATYEGGRLTLFELATPKITNQVGRRSTAHLHQAVVKR